MSLLEDVEDHRGAPVVENRGTGIRAMREAARQAGLGEINFEDRIGYFRVVVPRSAVPTPGMGPAVAGVNDTTTAVLQHLRDGERTRAELEALTGLSKSGVTRVLRKLCRSGLVEPTTRAVRSPHTAYRLRPPVS